MKGANDATALRATLLGFIGQRLEILRRVQKKEHAEFKNVRSWFREVARGETGFYVPDTTRWHEAARAFKEAAEAMARGNLARGAQLLERALGAEQAAFESMPEQVRRQLEGDEKTPGGYPAELPHALDEAPLPPCALPGAIGIADEILALQDRFEENPPSRVRRRRGDWWEQDEDEEEDEEKASPEAAKATPPVAQEPARPEERTELPAEDEQTELEAPEKAGPERAQEAAPAAKERRARRG